MRRSRKLVLGCALALGPLAPAAVLAAPTEAAAAEQQERVLLWPTLSPSGDGTSALVPHVPTSAEPAALRRAQDLDATLRDALQDLGFVLALSAEAGPPQGRLRDADLLAQAAQATPSDDAPPTWLVSPRIEEVGDDTFVVRIVAVAPRSKELRVRTETVRGADVAVRGLVLLRDLLRRTREVAAEPVPCVTKAPPPAPVPHSQGRAVLAVSGALFGGFLAFSMHRVAISGEGDGDPRVLFPLLVLGAGAGLGASLLAAEEWDVRTGDAWYFTAAAGWGSASGLFLASGYDVQPLNDRFYWGITSGLIGASLGVFALSRKHVDEGGALLTHSTSAYGLFAGSAIEAMIDGRTDPFERPVPTGQGYGTAIGLVGGGLLALLVKVPSSRVLMLDLGLSAGALVGAAIGSPLVTGELTPEKTRAFLGLTLAGSLVGGAAALWFTRGMRPEQVGRYGMPWAGAIGASESPTGPVPAWGAGWRGTW